MNLNIYVAGLSLFPFTAMGFGVTPADDAEHTGLLKDLTANVERQVLRVYHALDKLEPARTQLLPEKMSI